MKYFLIILLISTSFISFSQNEFLIGINGNLSKYGRHSYGKFRIDSNPSADYNLSLESRFSNKYFIEFQTGINNIYYGFNGLYRVYYLTYNLYLGLIIEKFKLGLGTGLENDFDYVFKLSDPNGEISYFGNNNASWNGVRLLISRPFSVAKKYSIEPQIRITQGYNANFAFGVQLKRSIEFKK